MIRALSSTVYAGIDPGKTGALAILQPDNSVDFFDVPMLKIRGKEQPAYGEWATKWSLAMAFGSVDKVVIEDVASRPGQGVSSMFKFGRTLGFAHAIVLGLSPRPSVEFVTPAKWKAKLGLLNSGKGASRDKAVALYPRAQEHLLRVKDDGRAEALLMAHYGRLLDAS